MVEFEMPLKNGGYINYNESSNTILIEDDDCSRVELDVSDLIKFTETNFWKFMLNNTKSKEE